MTEVLHQQLADKGYDEPEEVTSTSKMRNMQPRNESPEKLDEVALTIDGDVTSGPHVAVRSLIADIATTRQRYSFPPLFINGLHGLLYSCLDGIWRLSVENCMNLGGSKCVLQNAVDVKPQERHDIPRHEVQQVICSLCGTEQDVQQICVNCGVCMGKYFCEICKFYDDDLAKQQYHCDGCGICRTGGQENFFHCYRCGCCYSVVLKDCHPCVERAMHHNCPVCFEFLFESTRDISVLPCGHTIHMDCLKEMHQHLQFSCPVCSKSVCDMSKVWEKLDEEVAATPMPDSYQNKK
ncbi:hypothetical protein KI387_033234, partial [Taxus chinensis]